MKRFYLLLVVLITSFSTIFLSSCETDIDLTADWKDITLVYGVLNQKDSVHYLRINKAFLGDGNAIEYAKISDSSTYYDNLEVTMTESDNIGGTRVFTFDTIHVSDKESGLFYEDGQIAYRSVFKLPSDKDKEYKYSLKVVNKITGKEITSSTNLVKDFGISTPRPGQPTIDFISTSTQNFKWNTAKNGRRYDAIIRFWFEEVIGTDTIDRYIDWKLGTLKSATLDGGEELGVQYQTMGLYEISKSLIPRTGNEPDGIREEQVRARLVNKVDFLVVVAGDALNTYLDINQGSSGIVQDRPEYTNIVNGYGIFSSITSKANSIVLGAQTEAKFIALPNLKFVDKLGNK